MIGLTLMGEFVGSRLLLTVFFDLFFFFLSFLSGRQKQRTEPLPKTTADMLPYTRYTDQNGWPLSKIVLVETEGGVELHYPPYDIVLTRE